MLSKHTKNSRIEEEKKILNKEISKLEAISERWDDIEVSLQKMVNLIEEKAKELNSNKVIITATEIYEHTQLWHIKIDDELALFLEILSNQEVEIKEEKETKTYPFITNVSCVKDTSTEVIFDAGGLCFEINKEVFEKYIKE